MNDFAREVAKMESGKQEVSISQIKEIIKCAFMVLNRFEEDEIIRTVERYAGRE